jgi:hypothetical protein
VSDVAPDNRVTVPWIDLYAEAAALESFGGDQRAAAAQEQVQHPIAPLAAVANGSLGQREGLLRGMPVFPRVVTVYLPQSALIRRPVPAMGVAIGLPTVEAELCLLVVVAIADGEALLGPRDHARDVRAEPCEHDVHGPELAVAIPDVQRRPRRHGREGV